MTYKSRLAGYLKADISEVEKLYKEIDNSGFMRDILAKAEIKKGFFELNMAMVLRAPTLYVVCRLVKPQIVVETGVAEGFSSAFILQALKMNNKGKLYSIDLPNQPGQVLEGKRATGWLVPQDLKDNWTLILGASKDKLPPLLEDLKKIDVFYHDSEHSYENMTFEFDAAYKYLDKGSIILSDDITDNDSFADFCDSVKHKPLSLFKLGILRK
jgi:predicted O-methyltransferase YrrM